MLPPDEVTPASLPQRRKSVDSLCLFSSDTQLFADLDDEIERLLVIAKQTVTDIKPAAAASPGESLHVGVAVTSPPIPPFTTDDDL